MGRDKETRRSWDDTEVVRLTHKRCGWRCRLGGCRVEERTRRGRAVVEEEVKDSREDGKEEEAEEEGEEGRRRRRRRRRRGCGGDRRGKAGGGGGGHTRRANEREGVHERERAVGEQSAQQRREGGLVSEHGA
jgi:hypothetical protein